MFHGFRCASPAATVYGPSGAKRTAANVAHVKTTVAIRRAKRLPGVPIGVS
jgi:hypothetical protein